MPSTTLSHQYNTIEGFDATLHRTVIEGMRAANSKPWSEWTVDDIPCFLDMRELGEQDFYHEEVLWLIDRSSCRHYLSKRSAGERSMWAASLGGSEGNLGRIVDNWTATHPLDDLHNLENAAEV